MYIENKELDFKENVILIKMLVFTKVAFIYFINNKK